MDNVYIGSLYEVKRVPDIYRPTFNKVVKLVTYIRNLDFVYLTFLNTDKMPLNF